MITFKDDPVKIITGTSEGNLFIYKWNEYGDFVEKLSGHPDSISCPMINYDEDHLISGCDDGYLRLVEIAPNRIRDLIGFHELDNDKIPILGMDISNCRNIIGTISTDYSI